MKKLIVDYLEAATRIAVIGLLFIILTTLPFIGDPVMYNQTVAIVGWFTAPIVVLMIIAGWVDELHDWKFQQRLNCLHPKQHLIPLEEPRKTTRKLLVVESKQYWVFCPELAIDGTCSCKQGEFQCTTFGFLDGSEVGNEAATV